MAFAVYVRDAAQGLAAKSRLVLTKEDRLLIARAISAFNQAGDPLRRILEMMESGERPAAQQLALEIFHFGNAGNDIRAALKNLLDDPGEDLLEAGR